MGSVGMTLAAAMSVAGVAVAAAGPASPTEVVSPFYGTVGLERDLAARNRFTDPARAVLDSADRLQASGQGECLDPNMALDNVDPPPSNLAETLKMSEAVTGPDAKVAAIFQAPDGPHRLEWRLKLVDGVWKISDLLSATNDWALSQYHCE
jgi:hypothetical protein